MTDRPAFRITAAVPAGAALVSRERNPRPGNDLHEWSDRVEWAVFVKQGIAPGRIVSSAWRLAGLWPSTAHVSSQ